MAVFAADVTPTIITNATTTMRTVVTVAAVGGLASTATRTFVISSYASASFHFRNNVSGRTTFDVVYIYML